jgi:hypothetical protein
MDHIGGIMECRPLAADARRVAANRFADYAPEPNPETRKKVVVSFALSDHRPPGGPTVNASALG